MKKYILGLAFFSLLLSCSTTKMVTDPSKASPIISYGKGPCFGKCPIYTVTVYNTGLIKFNGVRFTDKEGKFEKQLEKKEYSSLIKLFEDNRFWRFDDSYSMDLVDASTTTISYSSDGKTKTVKGKSGFPDKLKEIMQRMDMFEKDSIGWKQTEKSENPSKQESIIENQIIIKTGDGMIMSSWLQEYKDLGVRLIRKLGHGDDLWLIRYDISKIKPAEMIEKLKSDKFIKEADFNTKVSDREQ